MTLDDSVTAAAAVTRVTRAIQERIGYSHIVKNLYSEQGNDVNDPSLRDTTLADLSVQNNDVMTANIK